MENKDEEVKYTSKQNSFFLYDFHNKKCDNNPFPLAPFFPFTDKLLPLCNTTFQ